MGGIEIVEEGQIQTNLEYRKIKRDQDTDYFIETLSYPVCLELDVPCMSRIQFPKSRAVLVRTSPELTSITVHIMRDVDLYSSFANFEIKLEGKSLAVIKKGEFIEVAII